MFPLCFFLKKEAGVKIDTTWMPAVDVLVRAPFCFLVPEKFLVDAAWSAGWCLDRVALVRGVHPPRHHSIELARFGV